MYILLNNMKHESEYFTIFKTVNIYNNVTEFILLTIT